jgi:sigma-B regulation protein RsbU (phosphoserine phosphatase)
MEELEAANTNLISMNREMEKTHEIIDQDMKLANAIQKKFLPQEIPQDHGWDVAFYFKPMSDVSGDFYDFYEEDGILKGISLCDISGHGVSSGLITMIAKTLLFRSFFSNKDKPTGEILKAFNKELNKEIGNMDNYLTGILLKLNSSEIEYSNAGHPDLIIHRFNEDKDAEIVLTDFEEKGYFLGMPDLIANNKSIKVPVYEGDVLVLYSDCLFENRNNLL